MKFFSLFGISAALLFSACGKTEEELSASLFVSPSVAQKEDQEEEKPPMKKKGIFKPKKEEEKLEELASLWGPNTGNRKNTTEEEIILDRKKGDSILKKDNTLYKNGVYKAKGVSILSSHSLVLLVEINLKNGTLQSVHISPQQGLEYLKNPRILMDIEKKLTSKSFDSALSYSKKQPDPVWEGVSRALQSIQRSAEK